MTKLIYVGLSSVQTSFGILSTGTEIDVEDRLVDYMLDMKDVLGNDMFKRAKKTKKYKKVRMIVESEGE